MTFLLLLDYFVATILYFDKYNLNLNDGFLPIIILSKVWAV